MSWLDFIGNVGNKVSDLQSKVGNALGQALIGKQEPMVDYVNIKGVDVNSPEFAENDPIAEIGVAEAPRVGGLLNDIRNGAKENFATGFAAPNWEQNITPDGRKKGMGYRFGEGLGSFARFAESPLGRGLLMAGIVGASGGSGLEALGYGTGAGLLNQQSRMKDSIYRNSLIEQGQNSLRNTPGFANLDPSEQQAQLDRIANQVNSYRGYLGDDTYKQVLAGMQLRDNAEYRNALLAGQRKDQEMAIQQRQAELKQRALSEAADRALKSRGLDIQERNIQKGTQKFRTAIGDKDGALQQIQEMKALVKANPKATGYIVGKFAKGQEAGQKFANEFLSRNPEAIKTRAAIAKLRGTTMHDLAGTAQTLQEQRNLAPFLPDATDNAQTILAKLEQLEKELLREKQTLVNTGYELGFDYDNTQPKQQTTQNEGWAF